MVAKRNIYRVLAGKQEGERSLGIPRRRWNNNIKTDLREVRWGFIDWIYLVRDSDHWKAVVNTVINLPAQ
jgi:hypothetical protein